MFGNGDIKVKNLFMNRTLIAIFWKLYTLPVIPEVSMYFFIFNRKLYFFVAYFDCLSITESLKSRASNINLKTSNVPHKLHPVESLFDKNLATVGLFEKLVAYVCVKLNINVSNHLFN